MGEQDIDVQKGIADLTQYCINIEKVKAFPNKSDHGENCTVRKRREAAQ